MKLIAGKLNRNFIESLMNNAAENTEEVKAAIAYANGDPKLLSWCWENKKKLTYYGRYDLSVPISPNILKTFLDRGSPNFVCKLVPDIFHPKLIHWVGYGAYIGSANLTEQGWMRNIECGLFLNQAELISHDLETQLEKFFDQIDSYSHPLSQETYLEILELDKFKLMTDKETKVAQSHLSKRRTIPVLNSLISVERKDADVEKNEAFLKEWNSTLQTLRDISKIVSAPEYRPKWVSEDVAPGAQADQFLHAFYYNKVKDGIHYPVEEFYQRNRSNPEKALMDAVRWWSSLESAPSGEDKTFYEWLPYLKENLAIAAIAKLDELKFIEVCRRVHAIRDHALRMGNDLYNIPKDAPPKERDKCIDLLGSYLYNQRSLGGKTILEVIQFVLYGGSDQDSPHRLWTATTSEVWKIPHFGLSSLGEMIGWARPNNFPPRNGRTSKALKALGYGVRIHSGGS